MPTCLGAEAATSSECTLAALDLTAQGERQQHHQNAYSQLGTYNSGTEAATQSDTHLQRCT
jgi:hypothetical protein